MTTRILTVTSLVALGLTSALVGACDSPDYLTYRVASTVSKAGNDCYPGGVPDDVRDDTNSLRVASSIHVFEGPGDERFLEFGNVALVGTLVDGTYTFEGETNNVEYPADGVSTRSFVKHTVSFTEDGPYISGTYTLVTDFTCTGPMGTCDGFPVGKCTETTEFTGSEVDLELTHDIDPAAP